MEKIKIDLDIKKMVEDCNLIRNKNLIESDQFKFEFNLGFEEEKKPIEKIRSKMALNGKAYWKNLLWYYEKR